MSEKQVYHIHVIRDNEVVKVVHAESKYARKQISKRLKDVYDKSYKIKYPENEVSV